MRRKQLLLIRITCWFLKILLKNLNKGCKIQFYTLNVQIVLLGELSKLWKLFHIQLSNLQKDRFNVHNIIDSTKFWIVFGIEPGSKKLHETGFDKTGNLLILLGSLII